MSVAAAIATAKAEANTRTRRSRCKVSTRDARLVDHHLRQTRSVSQPRSDARAPRRSGPAAAAQPGDPEARRATRAAEAHRACAERAKLQVRRIQARIRARTSSWRADGGGAGGAWSTHGPSRDTVRARAWAMLEPALLDVRARGWGDPEPAAAAVAAAEAEAGDGADRCALRADGEHRLREVLCASCCQPMRSDGALLWDRVTGACRHVG